MASEKKTRRSLQDLLRHVPDDDDQVPTLLHLFEEPDYVLVLIATSWLDHALEESLMAFFQPLSKNEMAGLFDDSKDGPLSTFSAKIRIAYALGAFGPRTKNDLNAIRRIRNAFAHAKQKLSFADSAVADAALGLFGGAEPEHDVERSDLAKKHFAVSSLFLRSGLLCFRPPRASWVITKGIPEGLDTVAVEPITERIADVRLP